MDIFLIIGLVLGAICIMMALILKGVPSVAMLLNGEVAVIIFGGMIAAVLSSYTMADIKRLPKVMKVLMSNEEARFERDDRENGRTFKHCSSRRTACS